MRGECESGREQAVVMCDDSGQSKIGAKDDGQRLKEFMKMVF